MHSTLGQKFELPREARNSEAADSALSRASPAPPPHDKHDLGDAAALGVLIPLPLNGMGVGYTCSSLARWMADERIEVTVVTSRNELALPSIKVIETLPRWARHLPYRWIRGYAGHRIEQDFLSCFEQRRLRKLAANLWPDASLGTIHELKRRGVTVFREQFNCHTATAKRILDQAYGRLGVEPAHKITAETVEGERRVLDAVDYVFCPSPLVRSSLLENGIPARKLLDTTYGWDPERFAGPQRPLAPAEGITALFVGAICVRKGAHLLLDYWQQSGIKGRLVLAGELEPIIKEKYGLLFGRDDIVVLDYSKDVGALYKSADMFLFPSLEEGSPLVIYEACGCGLPTVTSPMGAGRIVRHDCEGFVIDPYDAAGWCATLRKLAADAVLRRRMSNAAFERARLYSWEQVAAARRQLIFDALRATSQSGAERS
ncbi:glycosyltransferase family 4 protein [Bradyrhizobium sp. BR 10261]|uniref:glycosyltransferase family 4 protein n=1 Tax=Bradyrhizobium sp. BR 10261 TaxID=2749992 RepID=UPI001C64F8C4|nr:glycosyltransferase family 4 protein [Bradyrhizobium sp. BR 10261]MBW7961850.1 glycosyltransferase family 4 protein [Bradyrhizobium sp. BR 10261]